MTETGSVATPHVDAALAFGANLQNPEEQVRLAIKAVSQLPQTTLVLVSSLYRTKPWGVENQDVFINACATIRTSLPSLALLRACLAIERQMGRDRISGLRWGPRLIDIDILVYGDEVSGSEELALPHPRMLERAFVLAPLVEIAPDLIVNNMAIKHALAACDSRDVERFAH